MDIDCLQPSEPASVMSSHLAPHPFPVEAPPVQVPWVQVMTAGPNAAARLVEAVQREDLTREQIAQAILQSTIHEGIQGAAASFMDQSQRVSLHRFCATVRAVDPNILDLVVDQLCNKRVSSAIMSEAQIAMQEQRQRQRLWRQRTDMHDDSDMSCGR